MTRTLLLDNSAWVRLGHHGVAPERSVEIADALEAGGIAVCLPFLLEAGYSVPSAADHDCRLTELLSLPRFHVDEAVEQRALDAQSQLARAGHHRLPPVDVLIAAIADRHQLGVLHYDRDYDVLAERTDLRFESTWLAPAGSL